MIGTRFINNLRFDHSVSIWLVINDNDSSYISAFPAFSCPTLILLKNLSKINSFRVALTHGCNLRC